MQSILEQITDWLKSMIISGIMGNLSGMFDSVNQQVGQIAGDVGTTPANFSPAVFSMIRNISESVILPIAGMVLTFIACYELIQMLIEHNNLANFETWTFFKWVFKTFLAVTLISNTFNITMAVFDVAQQVISRSGGLISGSTGWMDKHGEEIKKLCTQGGKTLFWASNFSLGVTIFSAVNKYLAKIMNQFPAYDVTMSETHHIHKLDAPSGTAITLAEEILENIDRKDHWVKGTLQAPDGSVSGSAECAADEIPVSSIREGEVPGIHVIRYESEADSIILTHDAKNRKGFALGAVLAAEYTADKQGYLGMSDLFPFLK